MLQTSAAASAQPVACPNHPEPASLDPLLRFTEDIKISHALIIAEHGLAPLCALIKRGCIAATSIRPCDKAETEAYDLILVPLVTARYSLEHLTRVARRSLVPGGRLIAGIPPDVSGQSPVASALERRLRLNGFASFRLAYFPGIIVLQADLPVQPNVISLRDNVFRRFA